MTLHLCRLLIVLPLLASIGVAQTSPAPVPRRTDELRYVIYLERHGVRSPTGKAAQYDLYSSGAWPEWPVQPGLLTPHGFHLMELFGAYDRSLLASEGLLQPAGCSSARYITIYADSDQRTRETGKALARGLMPGCDLAVQALPQGTNDPIFHALTDSSAHPGVASAVTAVAGRLGGRPENLTSAYRPQLEALDRILACGKAAPGHVLRTSLFDIPARLSSGTGDHLVDLKGPLSTASTLAENLLLEYTEGMDKSDVGWGCASDADIAEALSLHAAATDYTQRTPPIARAQASNLMDQIRLSLEQAVSGKPLAGAVGKPSDQVLFLIGHDTNQENLAGLLNLTWIIDGRRDDTPPGGALVFELWRSRSDGSYSVRTFFTAQTLNQMRASIPLTGSESPGKVPVFVPSCGREDSSCDFKSFIRLLMR